MRFACILVVAACGGTPAKPVQNTAPSGSSEYRVRPGNTPGHSIVEDLRPPRARPYYEVGIEGERAYLVPRPDDELVANCTEEQGLGAIVRRYGLCDVEVSGAAFVERVNNLALVDALAIKRTLERALVFRVVDHDVWPPPSQRAVQELCARPKRSGLSEDLCFYYSPQHRTLEARVFPDESEILAAGLNELYGR